MDFITPAQVQQSLPWSKDAEQGLLSCFLQDPTGTLADAAGAISPEMFYHPGHRLLYEQMHAFLNQKEAKPLDLVTFSQFLIDGQVMDRVGGPAFLAELLSFIPTPAHYRTYKQILKDKWVLREGIRICSESIGEAISTQDGAQDWAAGMMQKVMGFYESATKSDTRKGKTFKELGISVVDMLANHNGLRGMPTGFPWMDGHTGGLQGGRSFVLCGGTSDGKSSLGLQMVLNAAGAGYPGSIFSLEMPSEEIWQRAASMEKRIRSECWRTIKFSRGELEAMNEFSRSEVPIMFYDDMDRLDEICAQIRLDVARKGIKWVMVDYLQLVGNPTKEGREREVALCSKAFKRLAVQFNLSMLVLSQLNDDGKLRESRVIGQDADQIAAIAATEDEDIRTVSIVKNRAGRRNVKCKYRFNGEYFQFTEMEEKHEK